MVFLPSGPSIPNGRTPSGNLVKATTLSWGGLGFPAFVVPLSLSQGVLPRISTTGEASREGRQGVITWVIDDLSGGFLRPGEAGSAILNWGRDKSRIYRSEGIWTHIPGITCLPPALTTQAAVVALDVSGYRAGNRRVHARMWNRRFIACIGPQLVKDTSTSNPALTVPSTADNITDDVLAAWIGYFNSTRYFVIATDDQTDDVKGSTDPTANSITWAELVTYGSAGDAVWAGDYFPDIGQGWNVMIGTLNGTNGVWAVPSTATIPVTAPQSVVDTDSRGVANSNNVQRTITITPTVAHVFYNSSPGFSESWSNPSNVIGSDDNRATNAHTAGTNETDYICVSLAAQGLTAADLPDDSTELSIEIDAEMSESNADDNVFVFHTAFWTNESTTAAPTYKSLDGANPVSSNTGEYLTTPGEIPTTDTVTTITLSTAIMNRITPAQIRAGAIGFSFKGTGTTPDIRVDDIPAIRIKFKTPGTQLSMGGGGGFSSGRMISNPTRLPYVEPEIADPTGITAVRKLRWIDLAYDSLDDRVTGTTATPYTGIPYVGGICEFQGGLAVWGGRNETTWNQMKIVDSTGQTRDLGFPGIHGAEAQTIVWARAQGAALLVQVADTDGADSQLWMYFDGRWSAVSALQSKSSAITVEPLLWGETIFGEYQGYAYNFLSMSTNLGASRMFIPSDLFHDPHLTNTGVVKHDGPLYVQTLELDIFGALEAQKTLLAVQSGSRRLDADVSYGDMRVLVDTGGDPTIAAAEVDLTFDAGIEELNIVSSGDPGIAVKSGIVRLIFDHQAGTAETPQGLPLIFIGAGGWAHQEVLRCFLAKDSIDVLNLYRRIKAKQATKRVQRFNGAGFDAPAEILDFVIRYRPEAGKTPPTAEDVESAYIDLRITPGSVT